jgi:Tol biopolymer transport system component
MPRSRAARLSAALVVSCVVCVAVFAVAAAQPPPGPPGQLAKNGPIVFQRSDPQLRKGRLYTIKPNGSDLRPLTKPGRNQDIDSQADWSSDGTQILFRRFTNFGKPSERADLLVVRADGTDLHTLTSDCVRACLGSEEGEFSPDGREIAFIRAFGPISKGGLPRILGLFLMSADGSNVRQLTQLTPNSGTEDHNPSWSPDGRQIVFMRVRQRDNRSSLHVIDRDGRNLRLLRRMPRNRPGAGEAHWSPDGKLILYSTICFFGDCGPSTPRTGSQLFTISPDGTGNRRLTHVRGNAYNGDWSPDGKKIVLARNPRGGPFGDLWTMNADGTGMRRIMHRLRLDAHNPNWGPANR